jgi:DNA-directed RNA polymerase subunit beta
MQKNKRYIDRISFSKIQSPIDVPNLLDIQKRSYRIFLQIDELPEKRKNIGIQAAFKSIFPISDFKETAILDFDSYSLGDWSCKCGALEGIENSKPYCNNCGTLLSSDNEAGDQSVCPDCITKGSVRNKTCDLCGDKVRLKIKYNPEECLDKGFDYSIPLKVTLRLALYAEDKKGQKAIRDVKEQEIFFGEIPFITERGTFIINGTERAVVSQLQRSPGVYFLPGKARGEYTAKIIPARGAWIELEEKLNLLQVRLDKKTKRVNITTFLKAMGLCDDLEILKKFYTILSAKVEDGIFYFQTSRFLKDSRLTAPVLDKDKNEILPAGKKLMIKHIKDLEKMDVQYLPVDVELFEDLFSASDIDGVVRINELISATQIKKLKKLNTEFQVFFPESSEEEFGPMIAYTLRKDKKKQDVEMNEKVVVQSEDGEDKVAKDQGDAFIEVFKKLRPGEPVTLEGSKKFFENMMKDTRRYDLSSVGRLKLNIKLGLKQDFNKEVYVLTIDDVIEILKYYLRLKYDRTGKMQVDDIDHLANRRIRAVGELVENAFRIGLMRLEKIIRERITNATDISVMLPRELLNTKPVFAAVKEFFGTSQLSQFMDQTNALAETTHKRRISALGPGGLNRERAGFEVRDVHSSHYGRICPIETPEGPNIGLISSLTTFARVNDYGFIETPYRKVEEGKVFNYCKITYPGDSTFKFKELVREDRLEAELQRLNKAKKELPLFVYHPFYLTAWEEEGFVIAQANAKLDENGVFKTKRVNSRKSSETMLCAPEEINYIDISPRQIVSVSASLIPFLSHDDANRALMGSNMQRQSVPLVSPETPIVGTGMEYQLVRDSGIVITASRAGVVMNADAERVIVKADSDNKGDFSEIGADLYELKKFRRSNQNTLINQRPLVRPGDRVEAGQVLCDGPASNQGELALGRNILAAFMPWRGYNYEDAIVLSERLVKTSAFNSIYIVEETVEARETKLGKEEITADIPGVSESILRHLDETGIVRIGAKVKPGEILVGKVSPKGETQLSPEEKLLRAIFGEQASEIKDTSLYCPPGVEGTVIDVKIFTRRGLEKDNRAHEIDDLIIDKLERNFKDEKKILISDKYTKIKNLIKGITLESDCEIHGVKLAKKKSLDAEVVDSLELSDSAIRELKKILSPEMVKRVGEIESKSKLHIEALNNEKLAKIEQMKKGDEFAPGIIKIIKVLVAVNRKISVGDKMAGRHGNKGVVAKILPEEDMPFLEDGTPLDIILNPLGVPSRMNVGQIYELILARAGKLLGVHFETPVFDGATEDEVNYYMDKAKLPRDGKVILYDGMTGEKFSNKITVGTMYMMKLEHMVDDKIHARSTGPYSLITQQPLGGKAQFGGQRVGEMEVWAFEAYGAAYLLQEILTIKSDNISGRNEIYSAIVKGTMDFNPGMPESFNVLIKELKSLALNVELIKKEKALDEARIKENIANIS